MMHRWTAADGEPVAACQPSFAGLSSGRGGVAVARGGEVRVYWPDIADEGFDLLAAASDTARALKTAPATKSTVPPWLSGSALAFANGLTDELAVVAAAREHLEEGGLGIYIAASGNEYHMSDDPDELVAGGAHTTTDMVGRFAVISDGRGNERNAVAEQVLHSLVGRSPKLVGGVTLMRAAADRSSPDFSATN